MDFNPIYVSHRKSVWCQGVLHYFGMFTFILFHVKGRKLYYASHIPFWRLWHDVSFFTIFRGKAPSQFKKGALKVTYNNNVQSFMSLTTTFNCTQKVKTLRQVHACCRKFIQLSKTVSFFFIQWFFTKLWRKTSRMYQS